MQALAVARLVNPVSLKVRCCIPSSGVLNSRSMTGPTTVHIQVLVVVPVLLFEKESSTYTYLLADTAHLDQPAVLVDPVDKSVERDVALVEQLGLKMYFMNTHEYTDHWDWPSHSTPATVTKTGQTKIPGIKSTLSRASDAKADVQLDDGEKVNLAN